jgi:hypothetical protein
MLSLLPTWKNRLRTGFPRLPLAQDAGTLPVWLASTTESEADTAK